MAHYRYKYYNNFDIHGSVHRRWFSRNTNKMQLCNRIYCYKVYLKSVWYQTAHYRYKYYNNFDIHGSVHRRWFSRNTNKMQLCNRIYCYKVYWRLNMFRAAHCSSSGALNCVCSLWFIYPCGDRPLPRQPWQRQVTTWVYKPLISPLHDFLRVLHQDVFMYSVRHSHYILTTF